MAGKTDYKNAWLAEKLDRINLTVPKGKKEIIQKIAAEEIGVIELALSRLLTQNRGNMLLSADLRKALRTPLSI